MSQLPADTAVLDALQGVTDGVVDLVGFEVCAVSIAQDEHTLETMVVSGSGDVRDQLLGLRASIADVEQQLAGSDPWHGLHCLRHDRPQRDGTGDDAAGWPPLDLLAAPVRDASNRLRGLVQIHLSRELQDPDEAAFDVLTRLVDQARHTVLNAIDRDRLVERVRLADAARLIVRRASSELSMDRIMELSQPAMASGFEAVGMWMQTFDEDGEATDLVYGATQGEIVIPDDLKELGRRIALQLWDSQQVAVATDRVVPAIDGLFPEEEQRVYEFMADTLDATSLLFVPLGAGRECLGNLALTRRSAHLDWSESEKQAASDIGHDLGRALLNARTFERERRLAAELLELDGYKSRLISTLAHELKNPLTAIAGHAEMLDSMVDLPGGVRHSIAAMERGAARMQHTIDDLLVLAEVDGSQRPLAPGSVDMPDLVRDVLDLLHTTIAAKGTKITVETAEESITALGEASGLDLICTNLVSNAVKYTPPEGAVTISLSRTDDEVEVAVTDTGIGIAEEDLGSLFQEFFRSTNPAAYVEPGTGLGLAIVQRIVDRHAGRIQVSSTLGVGTTFTVTMPAAPRSDDAGLSPSA